MWSKEVTRPCQLHEEFVMKDGMKIKGLVTSKSSELTSILQNRQRKEVDVKITIMGSDHAGLAVAAWAAELGHHVICHDSDISKIQALRLGKLPFSAPALQNTLARNRGAGRLAFSYDAIHSIAHAELIFIDHGVCTANCDASRCSRILRTLRYIHRWGNAHKVVIVNAATSPLTAQKSSQLCTPSHHPLHSDLGAHTLHGLEHGARHQAGIFRRTQQGVL